MLPASRFYRAVREFAVKARAFDSAIRIQTTPEEVWDVSIVSRRAYGNPNEFLAVMAAAGLDRYDQPLGQQLIILPTAERLAQIKSQTGYSATTPLSVR